MHSTLTNFTGCLSNIAINGRKISQADVAFLGTVGKFSSLIILLKKYLFFLLHLRKILFLLKALIFLFIFLITYSECKLADNNEQKSLPCWA